MANVDMFKDAFINEDGHDKSLKEEVELLKGNIMLKGVVSLEKLYNLQNHFKGPVKTKSQSSNLSSELGNT